jgi:hypothetical protein
MPKFLIEVPHEEEVVACARAVRVLLATGSHYLTHADWGCTDGVHKGWIIIEADNTDDARRILPVPYRAQAEIIPLTNFTMEEIDGLLRHHQ